MSMMWRMLMPITLLWLVMGTAAWGGSSMGEPPRPFQNCAEVMALAEPLMSPDAFEQLRVLSEKECMAEFGDLTPVELSHRLSEEATLFRMDDDGGVYHQPGTTTWIMWVRGFTGPGWLFVDGLLVVAAVLLTWLWCRRRYR